MEASDLKRVNQFEAEYVKLKRMNADLALEDSALKDLIARRTVRSAANRDTARPGPVQHA